MIHLRIYIAGHCPVSVYSLELAADVRRAFPHIEVSVVDIEQSDGDAPDDVLFTPGYFLNGRPVHWGNPTRERLYQVLREMKQESTKGETP
jgi:hypothetical protein